MILSSKSMKALPLSISYTEKGKTISVPARYTFTYEKIAGKWSIVEHHSSIRPETAAK